MLRAPFKFVCEKVLILCFNLLNFIQKFDFSIWHNFIFTTESSCTLSTTILNKLENKKNSFQNDKKFISWKIHVKKVLNGSTELVL